MINIRGLLFETNSSSVNSLAVFTEDAFNKYKQDNMYVFFFFYYRDGVITSEDVLSREEAIKRMKEEAAKYGGFSEDDDLDEALREWEYILLDNIVEDEYLNCDTRNITSPSGDSLVILSQYGYDG